MRSAAIFQIMSSLASMAVLTLPTAQALPVRGALGSLGARARAAKRAAHYAQQHPIMPEVVQAAPSASSVATAAIVDMGKRKRNEIKRSVTATATSISAVQTAQPIKRSFIEGIAQIVANNVVASIPILPQNNAAVVSPSSDSLETPSAVVDAGAIYASYIAAMGDAPSTILPSSSSPSSTIELDVAPTAFVVAAVQAVPVSSSSVLVGEEAPAVDQQAIYESYIAAMAQPTTGVWATTSST